MIDIKKTSSPIVQQESKLPVMLVAALCFVVWDSGYYKKWLPSQDREKQSIEVSAALLIKSPEMTVDQQYTASSPVLDEIADSVESSSELSTMHPVRYLNRLNGCRSFSFGTSQSHHASQ